MSSSPPSSLASGQRAAATAAPVAEPSGGMTAAPAADSEVRASEIAPSQALSAPIGADAVALCRATIAAHSKSFALASRVLPPWCRDAAAVLYTWCRRADDAVDLAPLARQPAELERLHRELASIYAGQPQGDVALAAFQHLVVQYRIPRSYPAELLAGMEMDVRGQRYDTMDTLLRYCFRVASTVGLMMSHVMGVRDDRALRNAAHLGIAMQLTNICRDVCEDWQLGRVYVPAALLRGCGLTAELSPPAPGRSGAGEGGVAALPDRASEPLARALRSLLSEAERYYRSGDRGLIALPWRCALGVRAARLVYAAIGAQIARRDYDVHAGRAVVPTWRKLWLLARAGAGALGELPARALLRLRAKPRPKLPTTDIEFPDGVLPL